MSSYGKNSRVVRKQDLQTQKSLALGFKKLAFYHKATAGDTTINLTNLSMPAELSSLGYVNPSATELAAARLLFFKSNLTLASTSSGYLLPGSYTVASSTSITLTNPALDGEIFVGVIDPVAMTAMRAVDARQLVYSGTLAAGATDTNVGEPFTTDLYSDQQVGAVLCFRNGKLTYRNAGNAAASVTADGDYQEVATSGSTGNLIRWNRPGVVLPDGSAEQVVVVSNGLLVERPTDSMMATIESVNGAVEAMKPYLAAVAGVDDSVFGNNPSNVDLRQFGDAVTALQQTVAAFVGENLSALRQYNLTVTGTNSWATTRAVGVPYQTLDGTWRMRFNVIGSMTSATAVTLTFSGVTFAAVEQAVTATSSTSAAGPLECHTNANAATIYLGYSTAVTGPRVSGDVELASKPTFVS